MAKNLNYTINELVCKRCDKTIIWTGRRTMYKFKHRVDGRIQYFCSDACKRHYVDDLRLQKENARKWKAFRQKQLKEKQNATK